MRAQAADVDDGSSPAFAQTGKTSLGAMKRAVERDIEDFAPFRVAHLGERLLPPQGCIVDEDIDAAKMFYRQVRHRLHCRGIGDVADMDQRLAAQNLDLARDGV